MKRKGIIFISLILLLIMAIMPLSSYAMNGGLVVSFNQNQMNHAYMYALTADKVIYTRDETIEVTTNFSRYTEGFYLALYRQNTTNVLHNVDYLTYSNYINDNALFSTELYFENGKFYIDLNSIINLDTGNYVISLVCSEKQLIYDYYIIIGGNNFALGGNIEPANYRISVNASTDTNLTHTIIDNQLFNSDDPFSVAGDYMLSGNNYIFINADIANISNDDKFVNAYAITFKNLYAIWKEDTLTVKPLTFRISIKQKDIGTKIIGYLNNVNVDAGDYTLYIPQEYIEGLDNSIDTADDVSIVITDVSSSTYNSYYSLSWDNLDINAVYIIGLDPDKNAESLGALEDAGNALGNVNKPEVDLDDLDINNYVDSESLNDITAVLTVFYNNEIFIAMIMLVISLAVIAYIFFGKR